MKSRILYIDNLKALAIFSVIVQHVYWFTWNQSTDNVWCHLIDTYFMPLFFFISGAFAKDTMTFKHVVRKAKQLLLPFSVVGGIYTLMNGQWQDLIFGTSHNGYWFLPVLFVMFVLFYTKCALGRGLKILNGKYKVFYDIVCITALWVLLKVIVSKLNPEMSSVLYLDRTHQHILSFFVGYLVFSNKVWVKKVLDKNMPAIYAVVLFLFVTLFSAIYYSDISIPDFSRHFLSLMALFILFVVFRSVKVTNEKVQETLSYIGQHTLEIYVLQYFFLPLSYTPSESFSGGVNSLALCIVESIVTLLFCIVMIKVLEINKYLRFFLLGK